MKRKTSIMQRITLMSWLLAVISVGVLALFVTSTQEELYYTQQQNAGKRLVQQVQEDILNSLQDGDYSHIVIRSLELMDENEDVNLIVVSTFDGQAIVHYREELPGKGLSSPKFSNLITLNAESLAANSNRPKPIKPELGLGILPESLITTQRFTVDSLDKGAIHIGMGKADLRAVMRRLYTNIATVGCVILIGGVLGAWIFAKNITAPLHTLQAFAYKVATGALNARASIETGDEIGDLAHSINKMVEALEGNQLKLRDSVKTEAAAREKEILLREIHHRVKNNMQILTSLLRLQARRANSAQLRTVLQESEGRIRSMGLLHEKLYQSESVSTIDMNGYLRSLTNELLRVNTPAGKRREVRLNVNNINLGMDTALPCGLIVTELVSNALKYAFPDHPEGIIYVSISLEQSGEYSLVVWDNGVGIPQDMDITKTESLGMRLVTMLSDQLNGKFEYANNQGTRWEIKFRESQYKIRL
jgi:two-component sensor histidine kinase